ncbi:uncharacterized protein [Hemitrygon akajei]|uniref:uncharacterized protein isoform X2 n=1 Tax=Hemitrygon akajei TaxID=2704970 RepID=UPI003BF9E9D7
MSSIERDWFPTHLRVTVIGARNLKAKGRRGLNNCYTVIRLGPEKYMTSVQGGTLNPEWKEECTLQLPLVLDNSDRWYDLQSKPNKVAKDRGQLQLAFQFLRDNMTASAYELSTARPQSVFNKFKDKVASLKYGMSHEILPNEGPSTSLKHHRNGRMSKSHSYVAHMDSRDEINATFNSAEANNQTEPEVHPYPFHSFHKNSGDDVHTKVKLRKENSSFVEDKSEPSAMNLEETTAVKLETKDTDHNKTLETAVAPELPKIETNPGNILTSYNHPVEFLKPSRFDDKLILTSFMLAGEGQDSAIERLRIKPPTCCAQCFRNAELRSR